MKPPADHSGPYSRDFLPEAALLTNTSSSSSSPPPQDKFRIAYLILYLQGVGCLFPWNAFITKTDYYALAFRGSPYEGTFESIITSSFTFLGLLTIIGLQHVQHLSTPRVRIIGALSLQLTVFLGIFAMSVAPLGVEPAQLSDTLQSGATRTFVLTVIGVALAGMSQAVLTGSLFSYAVVYDRPTYLQALSGGMGVAGLSVSLGSLVTTLPQTQTACADPDSPSSGPEFDHAVVVGAAVYFGLSCAVLLACLLAFITLTRLPFTLECQQLAKERAAAAAASETSPAAEADALSSVVAEADDDAAGGGSNLRSRRRSGAASAASVRAPRRMRLMPHVWMWAASLTLIYAVTLGLFPSLTSTIVSSTVGAAACEWRGMFIPVGFILFNLGDTIGRNLPGVLTRARVVLILVCFRVVFIPLFMMCNVKTSGGSIFAQPPLADDAWPLLIMAVFALSNGWLTTCALMHAPESVPPPERERAGSLMICFLNGGLFVGSSLSFVVKAAMCGGCNPFVADGGGNSTA
mgnify:CR=1 FL=1